MIQRTMNMYSYFFQESFVCEECHIEFSSKKLYKGHLAGTARHAGKTYACKQCDSVFARQSNLNAHVRVQHKMSVTLPHTCASCSKSFEHERGLVVHQGKCHTFRDEKVVEAAVSTSERPGDFEMKYVFYSKSVRQLMQCFRQQRLPRQAQLHLSTR